MGFDSCPIPGRTPSLWATESGVVYCISNALWRAWPCFPIETDAHLHRCLVYIDLNLMRAGVVRLIGSKISTR
mgnify:FL=1